ncbi:surface lipoprotein assembly modifier [Caulobacter sp. LARHSG274]
MISAAFLGVAAAVQALPSSDGAIEAVGAEVGAAMARRNWREAQAKLNLLPLNLLATPDVQFVQAFLARRLGRTDEAIDLYQRMLDSDGALLRVRLELADTFLEAGDDRAAEHNYRLALASTPPPIVRERVEARLKTIAERRRWRYSFSLAVAPDTNVNAATDARELRIFGLPFELSDEARRTSGVSLSTMASAERTVPLRGSTRLAIGGWGSFTDNEREAFDDGALGVRAGPQFWVASVRMDVQAVANRRWFGGEGLSTTAGVQTEMQWGWGRSQRHAMLAVQHLDYDVGRSRDAWIYSAAWDRTRFLSATRFWRLTLAANRADADEDAESFWLGRLSTGVYQTLPAGLAIWVEPSVERRAYDAPSVFGDKARRDTELALSARLLKRDWRWRGFSPYVGAEKSRNASNLDINDFTRLRVEFGATRTF